MKTIKQGIITSGVILLLSAVHTFAIEGLKIAVQCPNVVLSWPSVETETYIIQYRPTLDPSTPWVTLTNSFPAATGTNITFFVHSNVVQNCGGSGGGSFAAMIGGAGVDTVALATPVQDDVPMAIPANGTGSAVPLSLYPPGFNLAGFLIFDPVTGESVGGSGFTIRQTSLDTPQPDGPQPDGGSGGSGGSSSPDPGFYQVVRDGVAILNSTLSSLTNGSVSNTVIVGFEVGNADPQNGTNLLGSLDDVVVLVDGTRYRGAGSLLAPGIQGAINVDTSFLENGNHSLQLVASWLNPNSGDPNNHFFSRYSTPFTLSVSNLIYYPDWDDEIGELGFANYSFKTTCTNSTWQLDIYDVSNRLAKTLTGSTGNGLVETNWDLVDLNGVKRATNDDDYLFIAIITVGDPSSKPTPPKTKPFAYPQQGQWVIAYQDMFGNMVNSNNQFQTIYDFGGMAAQFGGAVSAFPTPGHPEYGQTFPMRYAYTNIVTPPPGLQILADETALMGMLTNSTNRNFFYMGHGGPQSIATINSQRIEITLGKRHYYRFVFLDACSTAAGDLPAAFGINYNSPQQLSYFQKHGLRPRTFLGYSKIVNFANTGDFIDPTTGRHLPAQIPDSVYYFLSNFEFYWEFGYDITTSVFNAETDLPVLLRGWADGPDLNLFGYQWLYINEYNYQADWTN